MGLLTRLEAWGDRANDRFEAAVPQRFLKFYRSVLLQVILVGLVALAEPGIWNAINNLGAGGMAEPWLINASNALTYALMIPGCALAGSLMCNTIGNKWTLVLGAMLYTPYASALYVNNRYGNKGYLLAGSALCGLGASMFWASEGAIAVGYPLPSQRGRLISVWMILRNCGPLIGGAISCAVNLRQGKNEAGKVSYTTYLALIGVQCVGVPAALLLSPTKRVRRPDGSRIPQLPRSQTSVWKETKAVARVLALPHIWQLSFVFVCGLWGTVYQSNFLARTFSVRSRALVSLLTACMNLLADVLAGAAMDWRALGKTANLRARWLWISIAVITTALWCWQTWFEVYWTRNGTTPQGHKRVVDYQDADWAFGNAFAVYLLWKFIYEAQLTFVYWLIGVFPHGEGSIEREIGVLRSWESVGSTFSYVVGATHWPLLNQGILAFAFWGLAIIPTTYVVWHIPAPAPGQREIGQGEIAHPEDSQESLGEKNSSDLSTAPASDAHAPDEKGSSREEIQATTPVLFRELAPADGAL